MRSNVIDLIIYIVRRMQIGVQLKDISLDKIRGFNNSEISAAYSWLIQKYSPQDPAASAHLPLPVPPRILHPSERNQITPEAMGYLIELYHLGIIDASRMERLIEYAMFRIGEKTEIHDIKEWVSRMIFDSKYPGNEFSQPLKGNETIH